MQQTSCIHLGNFTCSNNNNSVCGHPFARKAASRQISWKQPRTLLALALLTQKVIFLQQKPRIDPRENSIFVTNRVLRKQELYQIEGHVSF